ncbi:hypothetical protein B0H19DRAFT_1065290 [Mycena capillaripes]|nr:hypothetical protein B0H19DRAFT_1065290 [Mycena capillaripes]
MAEKNTGPTRSQHTARHSLIMELYHQLICHLETNQVSTFYFVVPELIPIISLDKDSKGKTAVIHMNSLVLFCLLQTKKYLELFKSLDKEDQECLGARLSDAGATRFAESPAETKQTRTLLRSRMNVYNLQKEHQKMSTDLKSQQDLNDDMQRQLTMASNAQHKSQDKILHLEIQYERLEEESQKAAEESEREITRIGNNLTVTSAVLADQRSLVSILKKEIDDQAKKLEDKEALISELESKLGNALEELEKANANVVNLEIALNQEKNKSKTSQEKFQKLLDTSSDDQVAISELQAENSKLQAEVAIQIQV